MTIFLSSLFFSYIKAYYFFEKSIAKNDQAVLETIKTLKKLIIFTASSLNEKASLEEAQKLLSLHYGYNLILDNDLILNNARMSIIRDGKLFNSLGIHSTINNQLYFVEILSKKYTTKTILYSDTSSEEEETISIVYTTNNSLNTFILSFPLNMLSPFKIRLLEKTGLKSINLPSLSETNKFLSEEFVSENAIFQNDFQYLHNITKKSYEILLISLVQISTLFAGLALNAIANFKKNRLLVKCFQILETKTEPETISKLLNQKNTILKLENSIKDIDIENRKLKKITEIHKKSVELERSINKTIAKVLDDDLQKISQLTTDSLSNFNNDIFMSGQMIRNLLNTIKNSTTRLLFLRNSHPHENTRKTVNVKNCFDKACIIFGPELHDIECKIDITHFDEELVYRCSEIVLIQIFNGILNRLLFSMEHSKGNFIRVHTENNKNEFKLIFENSSLGIHPPITGSTGLSSPFLCVPNWISTKAIAKTIEVSIEESFILAKGDTIILNFNSSNLEKGKKLNENVYALS